MDHDRRRKVIQIPLKQLGDVLAGRSKLQNFPRDAVVTAYIPHIDKKKICLLVHSGSFPYIPDGDLAPVVGPVLEVA